MDVCVCLTSGSSSCLAVWGDPTAHLSPSQTPSSVPSWSPSTPPQSTPPAHPHSATKHHENAFITSHAYYLIRIKSAQQSPAVHSCLLDSSRTASKLLGLDQMAIRRKRCREQIQWGNELLSHWLFPPTYKLTTRVKLCSGRMPYVCTSLSLLTLGSSGSTSLIFCTTTAWHASMPVGSDALSSYTIRGGRLGSGINLKGERVGKKREGREGGGMLYQQYR